eukprot:gene8531-6511_t
MWYARQRMFCDPTLHASGRLFNEWLVDRSAASTTGQRSPACFSPRNVSFE